MLSENNRIKKRVYVCTFPSWRGDKIYYSRRGSYFKIKPGIVTDPLQKKIHSLCQMKLQCQLIVKYRTYVLVVLVNESEIGKGQGRAVSTMVTGDSRNR